MHETPTVLTHRVAYHADGGAVLAALTEHGVIASLDGHPCDAVLLDSADIDVRQQLTTIMVLKSSVRVTCNGAQVTCTVLDGAQVDGQASLEPIRKHLASFITSDAEHELTLSLPVVGEASDSQAVEERERLKALSTIEPLRVLANATIDHPHLPLVAGIFAFDYIESFEHLPPVAPGLNDCPDYVFYNAQIILVIDHPSQQATLVGASLDPTHLAQDLDRIVEVIDGLAPPPAASQLPINPKTIQALPTISDRGFGEMVQTLRQAIIAGEVYQVVPSRGFTMPCPNALEAYRYLRDANPSPYMFYVAAPSFEVLGASPESSLLYSAKTGDVAIRPIAGTKPRGFDANGHIDPELDRRIELELRTDSKEIAEHVMLVDLARNDIARIAKPGTRKVTDLMRVDRYSRVMHLVSEVIGELADDLDALDAFRACMTMGTLTGAPKVRAAELIRQVEGCRRGSYGGAIGYIRGDGEFDTCIVIRSAFVKNGSALVQAGAGVVHDSTPEAEAAETLYKARAVLDAIAQSQGGIVELVQPEVI